MASRIELKPETLRAALKKEVASLTRATKTATNPGIKLLLEKDIVELSTAWTTITEVK